MSGYGIHEVGTARMGADPTQSVLNAFQQAHEVKHLFVTDGAGVPSIACQNPTLTIMALTVRSCDSMLEQLKTGNLYATADETARSESGPYLIDSDCVPGANRDQSATVRMAQDS